MNHSILPDHEIQRLAKTESMIDPFEHHLTSSGVISYGLSSFGYDARLAMDFKIFKRPVNLAATPQIHIDPKNFNPELVDDFLAKELMIPPHGFVLGRTLEYFKIPNDVMSICMGKSTYARCGLIVNVTPLEPGWEGHVTIEISNTTSIPVKVYAHEGICQFLFFRGQTPIQSYATRSGKYQGQTGVTLPRISE